MLDNKIKQKILAIQKNEITEFFIYDKLSKGSRDLKNKEVLKKISNEELAHYKFWKKFTNKEVKIDQFRVWFYFLISKIFGITFGLKLMEKNENLAQLNYKEISTIFPETKNIIKEEEEHEEELLNLIEEERLKYISSIVLGLNDALVELTGALAGFTLALQNNKLIATTGLITGIAASLSMAASEYLSTKSEEGERKPFLASTYTGLVYFFVVLFLIFPYLIFKNVYFSLALTIFNTILVIILFSFYISVIKDISFKERFFEMAPITLGITLLTFLIGFLAREFLKLEV